MLWLDLMTYLPDDILTKVDRTSMVSSLEVRSPLLDHKVVEFMATMPMKYKLGMTESKILLRRVAQRYLPDSVLKRKKQGFAIPLASWLQNELKPWMQDILLSSDSRRGYFKTNSIERMVDQHLRGRRDYSQQLWALMMLEVWLRRH